MALGGSRPLMAPRVLGHHRICVKVVQPLRKVSVSDGGTNVLAGDRDDEELLFRPAQHLSRDRLCESVRRNQEPAADAPRSVFKLASEQYEFVFCRTCLTSSCTRQ